MANEIVIRCPYCGDHDKHPHCYINIGKRVFNCFYCGEGGSLRRLTKEHPHIKGLVADPIDWSAISKERPTIAQMFSPLVNEEKSVVRHQMITYLESRGMTIRDIIECKVQYCVEMPHRAIFPDFSGGPEVFWIGRSTVNSKPKWLFASDGATKAHKEEYVWWLDKVNENEDIWVAEGVFDALAVRGVAVLGKKPSNLQIQAILSKNPRRVIIAFDNDAIEDAKELQKKIRSLVPTGIALPPKGSKDFGEEYSRGWRRP